MIDTDFLKGGAGKLFEDFWSGITVADFFDIALVAFLIYAGLILLRRTKSYLIFNGIVVSFLVYLVARFFNFYLTTLFFRFFFTFFIVILAVIFQKELRSFFEWISVLTRTKYRGLLGKKTGMASDAVTDIIIKAAAYLSHRKTGSIIVLRGQQPLGGMIEGGYDLEGKLSLPLLLSIFDPSSPGHDGAVVVENEFVKKFGVHLPLAERFMKFGDLGTRHRAALGLSEQSDALVIVTSEERGTISVAYQGDLKALSGVAELKEETERFFFAKGSPQFGKASGSALAGKERWFCWFTKDVRGKLIAAGLAVLLWFVFVPRSGVTTKQLSVPIEFRFLSQNLRVDYLEPNSVALTLSGKTQDFNFLDEQILKITINSSTFSEGWYTVVVYEKDINKPSSLSAINLSPDSVRFHISKAAKEPVPTPSLVPTETSAGTSTEAPE